MVGAFLWVFRVYGFRLDSVVLFRYMRSAVALAPPKRPVTCPGDAHPRIQRRNQHKANDKYDTFH
jgi:hypothetical protein